MKASKMAKTSLDKSARFIAISLLIWLGTAFVHYSFHFEAQEMHDCAVCHFVNVLGLAPALVAACASLSRYKETLVIYYPEVVSPFLRSFYLNRAPPACVLDFFESSH